MITGLLIKSFALGMAFMLLLSVAYWYVVLREEPETYDETPEVKSYAPPKPHAYNWAKDNRHGAFKAK